MNISHLNIVLKKNPKPSQQTNKKNQTNQTKKLTKNHTKPTKKQKTKMNMFCLSRR